MKGNTYTKWQTFFEVSIALSVIIAFSSYHLIHKERALSLHKVSQVRADMAPYSATSTVTIATSTLHTIDTLEIPVLTYHRIRPHKATDSRSARSYITTPEIFERELMYLRDHHFTVIVPQDILDAFSGKPLPKKPVLLTFDDGYKEQYMYAVPLLKKYQMQGTFFLYTEGIDHYRDYMSWEEVNNLLKEGMVLGGHSKTHAKLTKESEVNLVEEITVSKKRIEEKTNSTLLFFAYPYGLYNDTVISYVTQAGYVLGFGLEKGTTQKSKDRFSLRRNNLGSSFEYFVQVLGEGK